MLLVHNILGCIYTSEVAELLLMCIFMLKKVAEGVWTIVNFVSLFFKRSRYDLGNYRTVSGMSAADK